MIGFQSSTWIGMSEGVAAGTGLPCDIPPGIGVAVSAVASTTEDEGEGSRVSAAVANEALVSETDVEESASANEAVKLATGIALEAKDATAVAALARLADASTTTLAMPFSARRSSAASSLKLGTNRVHQNASRMPRSTIRCLRMKSTTSTKKQKPERMRMRSSQSLFSSAVTSCFEVDMTLLSVSCWSEVERRVEVDSSRSWVLRTERSSSDCMRDIVRRRASVTSELAFIRASSLEVQKIRIKRHG
jgi:hypothetical protein